MKENYIVSVEEDIRWNLNVSSETFALPCGMMMTTNYINIRVIISIIEEI